MPRVSTPIANETNCKWNQLQMSPLYDFARGALSQPRTSGSNAAIFSAQMMGQIKKATTITELLRTHLAHESQVDHIHLTSIPNS